jgi:tetratricopeptide (TPR) repeat protein
MNCASKLALSLCVVLIAAAPLEADLILDGKAAFAKGDYSAAADAFRSAIPGNGPSAGLYYNLAVAEQKSGRRAEAALSLRRALTLEPRMADARILLSEIERSQGVPLAPSNWREIVAEHAPIETLLIGGSALAWLGAFLLLFAIFAKAGRMLPSAVAAGLLLLGVGIFLLGYLADPRVSQRDIAVVCDNEGVSLLSSPANQSATVTRLPAASSVRILQERGEWTFCSAPSGEKGWAPSNSLQAVVPTV